MKYIAQGKTEAELITRGEAFGENGCYVKPTLFFKPKPGARIVSEEVFSPVAVIDTFQTEVDVVKRANDTEYGLGASLYTKDLSRAMRISAPLETGVATVNNSQSWHPTMPFGPFKGKILQSKSYLRC
jgi:aldehyde dehydrogenase (NAD+)